LLALDPWEHPTQCHLVEPPKKKNTHLLQLWPHGSSHAKSSQFNLNCIECLDSFFDRRLEVLVMKKTRPCLDPPP